MIEYTRAERQAGEPCDGFTIYDAAWCECIELQLSDRYGWVSHTMRCVGSVKRVELGARINGELVGGLVVCEDYDGHVGHCMSVLFHYVLPEYRHRGVASRLLKLAMQETKLQGLPVLAYTHRLCDWTYKLTYRRI